MLKCPCGLQYVGRTKRPLQVRLNEHINNIRLGYTKHSVSKHYLLAHNKNPKNTIFLGIDKFSPHWRGSHLVRTISQLEMSWVHRLKCYTPFGLNIEVDVNCFIANSQQILFCLRAFNSCYLYPYMRFYQRAFNASICKQHVIYVHSQRDVSLMWCVT